jgi:hypothetical protein
MMNCPPGTVTGSDRAKQSPLSNSQTQVRWKAPWTPLALWRPVLTQNHRRRAALT